MAQYKPLALSAAGQDPNALYDATLRVLHRKGLRIMSADRNTREVRTRWFRFHELGLVPGADGEDYAGSFRVTIRGDAVEVFTSCDWMNDLDRLSRPQACGEGERPDGIHDKEVELAINIIDESRVVTARAITEVQPAPRPLPHPPEPPAPGCTRDTECKGDRVCIDGGCVDSPEPISPEPTRAVTTDW